MAQDSYVMEPYRSSRGENDPQVQLRNALLENDFEKFEELVINGAVDLEYVYPYPDDKTCLELAVLEPNKIEFVKLILQHMTSVVLRMTEPISDTPILLAVKNRNIEALDALLEFSSFFINCVVIFMSLSVDDLRHCLDYKHFNLAKAAGLCRSLQRCPIDYSYIQVFKAFALSFYTLFKRGEEQEDQKASNPNNTDQVEEDFFEDPGRSLFKTIVMMTGEFDVGSIEFSTFPVTSHIIFILFVFMVPIVLFNLLNGLAVSDTQEIRSNAELLGHISRIKLISHYERDLLRYYKTVLKCFSWLPPTLQALNIIQPYMLCINPWATFHFLPNYGMTVNPNQNNRIELPDCLRGSGNKYCFGQCALRLDRKIVKNAKIIINKRTCVSEFDEIKHTLSKYETNILNMESTLKRVLQKLEAL
ncbi:uncharacterized protein LOC112051472 isoform X4 [Bicyclus anynana]|uniref:Uncharacterized protein LOC112051472 isoform X4 n=1 Tax=Bicyclus anynana TaxID=110368 RepID=A0ABM3LGL7_BICAN|nr:uncharacterized protein LOC112051472 isoform X4 [Bicyclus anynana]